MFLIYNHPGLLTSLWLKLNRLIVPWFKSILSLYLPGWLYIFFYSMGDDADYKASLCQQSNRKRNYSKPPLQRVLQEWWLSFSKYWNRCKTQVFKIFVICFLVRLLVSLRWMYSPMPWSSMRLFVEKCHLKRRNQQMWENILWLVTLGLKCQVAKKKMLWKVGGFCGFEIL